MGCQQRVRLTFGLWAGAAGLIGLIGQRTQGEICAAMLSARVVLVRWLVAVGALGAARPEFRHQVNIVLHAVLERLPCSDVVHVQRMENAAHGGLVLDEVVLSGGAVVVRGLCAAAAARAAEALAFPTLVVGRAAAALRVRVRVRALGAARRAAAVGRSGPVLSR